MVDQAAAAAPDFKLLVLGYDQDELRVISFQGREQMNGLYWFDVTFRWTLSDNGGLGPDMLHTAARLVLEGNEQPIEIEGIVTEFEADHVHAQGGAICKVRISPRMSRLHLRRNSRVFQNMSVVEVAGEILREHGVSYDDKRLSKTYPQRAYLTQYQETDLELVTRLLAEEGIMFFFLQPSLPLSERVGETTELLMLVDDPGDYWQMLGGVTLPYAARRQTNLNPWGLWVDTFERRMRAGPESLFVRTRHYLRPHYHEQSISWDPRELTGPSFGLRQMYEHHPEYEQPEGGRNVAPVHLEQHRAALDLARGTTNCRFVTPGRVFHLEGHAQPHLDGDYLPTAVHHEGYSPQARQQGKLDYLATFECVPANIAYRPPRPARAPREVLLTGVVAGPPGQEIHTDDLGRVKVHMHWDFAGDPGEKSSCYLRVATPWAGPSFGVQLVPRIGMEVLVGFIGGDLDNPVVVACLYNGVTPPPFRGAEMGRRNGIVSRSTPGGTGYNEISFDDTAGSEKLILRAEKDWHQTVGGSTHVAVKLDSTLTVGNHVSETIGGDRRTEVQGDQVLRVQKDRIDWVGGGRKDTVTKSSEVHVGQHLHTRVDGRETHVVGSDLNVEVMGNHTERFREGTTTVVAGDRPVLRQIHVQGSSAVSASERYTVEADDEVTLRCGKSTLRILPSSIELVSPEIRLKGPKAEVRLREGEVEIKAKELATLKADRTAVRSSGAEVLLGKHAKIGGTKIKLNCAKEPDDDLFPDDTRKPTHVEIKDQKGRPLAHRHYRVTAGDRDVAGGLVGKDGTDDIVLEEGDSIVFPGLGNVRRTS